MKRFLIATLILGLGLLASRAYGKLSAGVKSKLGRYVAECLDPFGAEESRGEAWKNFTDYFTERKRDDLAEIDDLTEILAGAPDRPNQPSGVKLKELQLKDLGSDSDEVWKYAISVPRKYSGSSRSDPWPLIVCIPDKGMDLVKYLDLYWKNEEIRDNYLIAVLGFDYSDIKTTIQKMVEDEETGTKKMKDVEQVVPFSWDQRDAGYRFWKQLWNLQTREYKVDPNRVILDGVGFGRDGAVSFAMGAAWRFSGLVWRGGEMDSPVLQNLSHIPVLYVGEGEAKAPEEVSSQVGDTLTAVRLDDAAWSGAKEKEGASLVQWLGTCVRDRYPLPSKWVAVNGSQRFGYWVFVTLPIASDQPVEISVSSDRKKNVVTVDCSNVAEFRLFLNDLLVDMGEEFTVVVNGEVKGPYSRSRSPDMLLQHAFAHRDGREPRDPGVVFTNEVEKIVVPRPPAKDDGGDKKDEGSDKKDGGGDKEGNK